MPKAKTVKKPATGGGKRKLSPYNTFMKSELPKVKAENPNLEHKAAFKLVAERWKNSAENPKY
nr:73_t:CDS:2 [Entrophospora candida]